ncbi:MAG: mannose-1-phosphate guanylyltransferase [Rhodospirillaceae bacterium]|nr:mannose-1-phosphate guanylyltransferase [Rhodospirillaceae bacterium]|tara:strand:+ start:1320 stop:2084 length:765 start_codon:yes stop_codon:yes gene_type:complete
MFIDTLPVNPCTVPTSAMILAAGYGRRMLPLTERIPKPMLVISGKTILDRTIDQLLNVGVNRVVINTSHLASVVKNHLKNRDDERIAVSTESEPLETGGGVVKALPQLGHRPFYVINGDSVWVDGMKCALLRLAESWDPDSMDALLMLAPLARAASFEGLGDFTMDQNGRLHRRREKTVSPYAYMGLSIINPECFDRSPKGAFSLNWLYDRAINKERLFGIIHEGLWYHISTPGDLEIARNRFANGHSPAVPFF